MKQPFEAKRGDVSAFHEPDALTTMIIVRSKRLYLTKETLTHLAAVIAEAIKQIEKEKTK